MIWRKEIAELTVSVEEYKELIEKSARIEAFREYVNAEGFSVDRRMCGIFLGFEVNETGKNK
ncbi:hypothetical protein [Eubacterium sp. 14-2]|uniref:hypothetical protein n=1 Tax=Eubacterium sp. 14-2 TaxID=1235790 RepID=UPI0003A27907|nr:hypothetical protein [Eubacterium sp. 14-2]